MRLLPILLTLAAAQAEAPLERVQQPVLRGFVRLVNEQGAAGGMEQWVLRGQTALNWTRMVTVQRFAGLARRATPDQYLATLGQSARAVCASASVGAVNSVAATYPAAQVRVDCPLNPNSGRPETFLVRAMAGYSDLYVVQVSLRRPRQRDEIEFAQRQLAGVLLCGPASREAACRAN